MIYIFVAFLLLFLSYYYDIENNTKNKDSWYITVLILLIMIAGMRYRLGTDTIMYINHFYYGRIPLLKNSRLEDFSIGSNPLWVLLNSVILSVGGKFFIVQFIQSAFVNVLLFKYIKKHSKHIFTCVFFYYIWMYTNQNMEELKASFSIIICFYANDYILDKKWVKAYSLYFVAVLFHPSTLLIFIMPFFLFLRFNKIGAYILIATFFIGILLSTTLNDYIFLMEGDDAIAKKAEEHTENLDHIGQLKSFSYLLVNNYIVLIFSLYSIYYVNKYIKKAEIRKFEPFIMFAILFLVFQMNIQIMYRFVHFYYIYVVFYLSHVFVNIAQKSRIRHSSSNVVKAYLVILPLLVCISYSYRRKYFRYYPYASIIERKIDRKREVMREMTHPWEPVARRSQY